MRLLGILFLLMWGFFFSCRGTVEHPEVDYSRFKDAEYIRDIRLHFTDSAALKAIITGPELLRYQTDEQEVFPQGIRGTFYSSAGNPSSYMHARTAYRFQRKKKVVLEDHVVLYNLKGDSLFTSQLTWDEKANKIYTDRFVRLTKKDRVILGYGFESNQDFTKGKIKAVEGTWRLEDD